MSVPVWLGVVTPIPVGGVLADAFVKSGALYPAGTPINITDRVITPALAYKVKAVSEGVATVSPVCNIMPEVGDKMYKAGTKLDGSGAVAITSVAKSGDEIEIAVAISGLKKDDVIILGEAVPNSYLYNDIYIGDIDTNLEGAGASGAAVMYHAEGILIDRTPAADIASQMAAAVPGVLQVNG